MSTLERWAGSFQRSFDARRAEEIEAAEGEGERVQRALRAHGVDEPLIGLFRASTTDPRTAAVAAGLGAFLGTTPLVGIALVALGAAWLARQGRPGTVVVAVTETRCFILDKQGDRVMDDAPRRSDAFEDAALGGAVTVGNRKLFVKGRHFDVARRLLRSGTSTT